MTTDPDFVTMKEEIFGPVLTVFVYEDDKIDETIAHMSESTRKYRRINYVNARKRHLAANFRICSHWCHLLRTRIFGSRLDNAT